jgi:acylphosphatase
MNAEKKIHVLIKGRVQGVGFRYSTLRQAQALGITGWVRNLPDGRVEARFEGPASAVEEMLSWCRQGGPSGAQVRDMETESIEDGRSHDAFQIAH